MDRVVIRRATAEDKSAILAIRDNVLDSLDYLPAYYDHLMTSPNVFLAVMVRNGKIIAFEAAHVVDNGYTVVTRARRVHPDFEGLGLVKDLSNFLIQKAIAKGAKSAVSVIGNLSSPILRIPASSSLRRILTLKYLMYSITKTTKYSTDAKAKPIQLSKEALSTLFNTTQIKDYLAPKGHMLINWVPFKLLPENIPDMTEPKDFVALFSDVRFESGQCRGLLSFGTVYAIPNNKYLFTCIIDIFGEDDRSLKAHTLKHLHILNAKTEGPAVVIVSVSENFNWTKVETMFSELNESKIMPYSLQNPRGRVSECHLYELWKV